ncbi:mgpp2cl-1, protein phosphatase 2C-like protein 1 [Tilletia horrida]|uniref:Mgpp2cl-1, protein phosphatase 2C-like protein 1 n=1 Tax=Tilletia horrida TaxID=155126 RepID=A0AAN6GEW4_9BASI|nr:mgpp2cl-1, protein phosphatase 2C-like protein 1 [Tilletia horrida]
MRDLRRGQDADNPNLNAQSPATTTAEGSNTHGTVNQHPSTSTAPSHAHHSGLSRAAAGSSGRWPFRVGVAEDRNKRWRRTMEDAHAFIYDFGGVRGQGFFSVFDGHAGKHAAEFCGKNFHTYLLNTVLENPTAPIPDILNATFQTVDRRLSELAKQQGTSSGCTAVTAFLRLETEDGKPAGAPETGGVVPSSFEIGSASGQPGASPSGGSSAETSADTSGEEVLQRRFRTGSSSHFGGAAAPNAGEDEDTAPHIIRLNAPSTESETPYSSSSRGRGNSGDGLFSSFTRRLRQYSGDRHAAASAAGGANPASPGKTSKRRSLNSNKSPASSNLALPATDSPAESQSQSQSPTPASAESAASQPPSGITPSSSSKTATLPPSASASSASASASALATESEDGLIEVEGKSVRRVLYTANAGDARAVLCRAGKAVRLTYDHKGSDPQETKRIQDAGGFVMNNRVNGVLAVTRSLGDSSMKDYVVGAPYTTETTLGADDTFLIVACDGLWDVTEDQDAVNLIADVEDPQRAAEILLKHALDNFSTDNTSIMVVRFAVKGESAADLSVEASASGAAAGADAVGGEEKASEDAKTDTAAAEGRGGGEKGAASSSA